MSVVNAAAHEVHPVHLDLRWRSRDGLELYAQSWEPDGGPGVVRGVVCLVHGVGEHSGRYAHVAEYLTRRGFAVLTYDQRGHGRSPGPRGHTPSYDALLADIDVLLMQASERWPDRPLFLYGHSMGGGLVLNYVLRRQPTLAGVVATSPWLRLPTAPPRWKEALAVGFNRLWPALSQRTGLPPSALSRDPAVVQAATSDPLAHDRMSTRFYVSCRDAAAWALAHAAEFPVPLLLLHGTADRVTSHEGSQAFAAQLPSDRCTLRLWEGGYHELHNEPDRADVLAVIADWLESRMSSEPNPNSTAAHPVTPSVRSSPPPG